MISATGAVVAGETSAVGAAETATTREPRGTGALRFSMSAARTNEATCAANAAKRVHNAGR